MPEMPDSSPSPPAEPSPAEPSSEQPASDQATPEQTVPEQTDEASVRLLLDALVRRLKSQPLELAERAVGQEGNRTHPKA